MFEGEVFLSFAARLRENRAPAGAEDTQRESLAVRARYARLGVEAEGLRRRQGWRVR